MAISKEKSHQILSDVQLLRHFASTFLVATDFAVTGIILIILFAKIRLVYDILMFFWCL